MILNKEKREILGEQIFPVPICLPQIPRGIEPWLSRWDAGHQPT